MCGKINILIVWLVLSAFLFAQKKPDWVSNNGFSAQFPATQFVCGFGLASDGSIAERKILAEQNARADLSTRFMTKIRSELLTTESETGKNYDSQVKSTISSQSDLTLLGVRSEIYEEHNRTYALAILEIEKALPDYQARLAELQKEIGDYLNSANQAEKSGDLKTALNLYRKTFPLFVELGETRTVLNLLMGKSPFTDYESTYQNFPVSQPEVERRIQEMLSQNISTISGAALSLAEQLAAQSDEQKINLRIFPLTFQETDFGSEFSAIFQNELTREMAGRFTILAENAPETSKAARLTGNYRIDNEQCRIQVVITDPKSGTTLSAAGVVIDKNIIDNSGIDLQPRNFEQAMADGRVFFAQDVVPGKLSVEAWTNKGDRNLIFKDGEESTLLVRVNKPCYLQIIYHLADGLRLLMYNNYYIDVSKVNLVVAMPDTFYVAPPYGVERWQVFAATDRFPEVPTTTKVVSGETYDNVLTEDLAKFTVATRGMQKKKPQMEQTEKVLTITTIR